MNINLILLKEYEQEYRKAAETFCHDDLRGSKFIVKVPGFGKTYSELSKQYGFSADMASRKFHRLWRFLAIRILRGYTFNEAMSEARTKWRDK